MKRCQLSLLLILISMGTPAYAFEECRKLPDATALRESISSLLVAWTPVIFFERLQATRLLIPEQSDALLPYAYFDSHGQPIVLLPLEFYGVLCRFVLAGSYIERHATYDIIDPARNEMARCLRRQDSFRSCLKEFALSLDKQFESEYAVISEEEKGYNKAVFDNALGQIVLHEYAHFFFDHHQRLQRREIERIDAEFGADFFAITQSAQNVAFPFAIAYFFKTVSDIESSAQYVPEQYEISYCRRQNVVAIAYIYDAVPLQMIDLAFLRDHRFTREDHAAELERLRQRAATPFDSVRCSRLATSYLRKAHAELVALYQRLYADADLLMQQDQNVWPGGLPVNSRVIALQKDLLDMAASFQMLGSLAAKLASMVTRRIGLDAPKTATLPFVQSLVDNANAVLMPAPDYGRLLGEYGLALFYTPSADSKARLQEVKRVFLKAIRYNPALSESWYHLGFVALTEGDCSLAAERAAKAAETCTSDDARPLFERFAGDLTAAARDGGCAAWGARAGENYRTADFRTEQ